MCDIGAFDLAIRTHTNIQIQQHEPRGARLNDYFNRTNPQWRRRCTFYQEKHVPY